jgi:hypothetical protein
MTESEIISSRWIAVTFAASVCLAAVALPLLSSNFARADDGWGTWEENKSEGGSLRHWKGGYTHCNPRVPAGKQAFVWECRPCEGAASGQGNYCWVAYSFDFMTCDPPPANGEMSLRVETGSRKTQKRCGPEEQKKTRHDTYEIWQELVSDDDVAHFGLPNTPTIIEQPPISGMGPPTKEGATAVPEDSDSFHKKEADEKSKTGTSETAKPVTPGTGTSKVEKRPRKEVKHKTSSHRKAKVNNDHPTSTSGASPLIGIGIGVGIGIGRTRGHDSPGGSTRQDR